MAGEFRTPPARRGARFQSANGFAAAVNVVVENSPMNHPGGRRAGIQAAARFFPALALGLALLAAAPAVAGDSWFIPPAVRDVKLAWRGDARAQAYLGFLYDRGASVPQNVNIAAYWYRCAAVQGNPHGQFLLGMAHDKGRGVPQDYVLAYAWTNLATAQAPLRIRRDWVRIRDAIASKMSLRQLTVAQTLTLDKLWDTACEPDLWMPPGR